MFKQLVTAVKIKDIDQLLDLEIDVISVSFFAKEDPNDSTKKIDVSSIVYTIKLPGLAGFQVRSNTVEVPAPVKLLGAIEGAFKAMLPDMLARLQ